MARRKQRSGVGVTLLLLFGMFLAVLVANLIGNKVEQNREAKEAAEQAALTAAYDEAMAPLRQAGYVCPEGADKAAVLSYEDATDPDGTFLDMYIPEEMRTNNAREVRYLVTLRYSDKVYTVKYTNSTKQERNCVATVTDLLTGQTLVEMQSLIIRKDNAQVNGEFRDYDSDYNPYFGWLPEKIAAAQLELKLQAYHELFKPVLKSSKYRVGGWKVTSLIYSGPQDPMPRYETTYIPEQLQAQTPEEVRYVVHCTNRAVSEGSYLGGGKAYRRAMVLEVEDLVSGRMIARQVFLGTEPPSYTTETGDQYGDYPDAEEISRWIAETMGTAQALAEAYELHLAMAAVLESEDHFPSGNKAISMTVAESSEKEGAYHADYIPAAYVAEEPGQVRYLVRCRPYSEVVGSYSFSNHKARRYSLEVEVVDLLTGRIVAEENFGGGTPPMESDGTGDQYGTRPSAESVEKWLAEVFAKLG